jgi:rhodanese-related sulfurtransferase
MRVLMFVGLAGLVVAASPGCKAVQACMGVPRSARDETLSMWTMEQVQAELGRAALFDANPRELYDEHHLPGARWVPYDAVTAELLPADKAQPLVFYCANPRCSASHVAARSARTLGFTSVHVMPDGIFGWLDAGRPTEP